MSVDREGAGAGDAERGQAGHVEQVGLVARLTEMGACRIIGQQLHRAEAVGQVDRDDRHCQHHEHRHRGERHEGAEQDHHPADELDDHRAPAEQLGERHADRPEDRDELLGSAQELRQAVREEAVAGDEAQRDRVPRGRHRQRRDGEPSKEMHVPHPNLLCRREFVGRGGRVTPVLKIRRRRAAFGSLSGISCIDI
jgi:hypothetical protein